MEHERVRRHRYGRLANLRVCLQAEKEEKEDQDKAKKTEIDLREAKRREAAMGPSKGKAKSKK